MSGVIDFFTSVFHFFTAYYFQETPPNPSLKSLAMKNIVILGASYAGVSTAHRILKQASKTAPFKITLVSPNTDIYWNMAAPRAAIGVYGDEKVFQPIGPGFKQYGDKSEFIVGTAQSLDVQAKTVGLAGGKTLEYDFLILATGSRTKGVTPFKGLGSTEETKQALHAFQEKVKEAKTIVIAGGGPTGIEFAAELAFEYGKKKHVYLFASGAALSEESPVSVQKHALKGLMTLGVDTKFNTKVVAATTLPSGQTEVTLSDGSKQITDLYVPTYGLVPNSSYIPSKFLSSKGFVIVDEHLKAKGAGDVWAIGDVVDVEWKQWISMDKQSSYVAKNIVLILSNKVPIPYKVTPVSSRLLGFSLGPKTGTGAFGSLKIPSFVLAWGRKELYTQNMDPTISGTLF